MENNRNRPEMKKDPVQTSGTGSFVLEAGRKEEFQFALNVRYTEPS